MNKQELINVPRILFPVGTEVLIKGKMVGLKVVDERFVENVVKLAYGEQITAPNDAIYVKDEPEAGNADEAPRYVKNILARLRELPLHDREVWLKAIMGEFEQDFSRAKWREGYDQGKFEGEWVGQQLKDADKIRQELNKPLIPQLIAEKIEYFKKTGDWDLFQAMDDLFEHTKTCEWLEVKNNQEKFALAWILGYEVEEEKRYLVKIKATGQCLGRYYLNNEILYPKFIYTGRNADDFTRKELEEAGFGWVFDCPGIEIEEEREK